MLPLDGGHALTSLLQIFRVSKPRRKASVVGMITGIAVAVLGLQLQMILLP